jgi:hypothetical protein
MPATVEMLQDTQNVLQILVNLQKTFTPMVPGPAYERAYRLMDDLSSLLWERAEAGDEKAIRFLTALSGSRTSRTPGSVRTGRARSSSPARRAGTGRSRTPGRIARGTSSRSSRGDRRIVL